MRIGLTGGIASGKSRIENIFRNQGYPVLDTDKVEFVLRSGELNSIEDIVTDDSFFLELIKKLSLKSKSTLKKVLPALYDNFDNFSRSSLLSYINNETYGAVNYEAYSKTINLMSVKFYEAWAIKNNFDNVLSSATIIERNNLHLVDKLYLLWISKDKQLHFLLQRENKNGSHLSRNDAIKAIERQHSAETKYKIAIENIGEENVMILNG